MAKTRPTMTDIAQALGISTNAVSLALANRPGVSETTRADVLRMARDLGYRPKTKRRPRGLTGVALVFNQTLLHPPATVFFGPVIEQLQRALARHHCSLTLFGISDEDEQALRLPPLQDRAFEGIVVLSTMRSLFVQALQRHGPVVWMDHYDPTIQCDKVVTENRAGAFCGVQHLIRNGHDSVGFLGDLRHSPSYVERWRGYRMALHHYQRWPRPEWQWISADHDMEHLQAFWDAIAVRPSAWFCVNDLLAVELLELGQRRGMECPRDFAIVGFDDLQQARAITPGISTLHVDPEYYARRTVELLVARLGDPTRPAELVRVIPPLIVRGSSGGREVAPAEDAGTQDVWISEALRTAQPL